MSKIHTYWKKLIDLFLKHAVEYKYSGFPKMLCCLSGSWTKQVPSKNPRCPFPECTLNVTKMTHGCRSIPWGTHKMVQMRIFKWKDILRTQYISQTVSHPPHPTNCILGKRLIMTEIAESTDNLQKSLWVYNYAMHLHAHPNISACICIINLQQKYCWPKCFYLIWIHGTVMEK